MSRVSGAGMVADSSGQCRGHAGCPLRHAWRAGGAGPAVSWPELMAAMSLACDTAMALPLETGLASCLVAMRLARAAGLTGDL